MCESPRPNTPEARRRADRKLTEMGGLDDGRPTGPWTAAMRRITARLKRPARRPATA